MIYSSLVLTQNLRMPKRVYVISYKRFDDSYWYYDSTIITSNSISYALKELPNNIVVTNIYSEPLDYNGKDDRNSSSEIL